MKNNMKYVVFFVSILFMVSCSKDDDSVESGIEKSLQNKKWNRLSVELNPSILLPKQDDSGAFFTVTNLMEIENLEGYTRSFEGFYVFDEDGTYSFNSTGNNSDAIKEGSYTLDGEVMNVVNSKGEKLTYTILSVTDSNLIMRLNSIFLGQETVMEISCGKL